MSTTTSTGTTRRNLLFGLLALFVVLHNDLWWWSDATFVLGFPIALTYHLAYCLAAAALMALLVRFAWPHHLDDAENEGEGDGAVTRDTVESPTFRGAP